MKLPQNIAVKLLVLLEGGNSIPTSAMQHSVVQRMVDDGVIHKIQTGRTKSVLRVRDLTILKSYLQNHFGITELKEYVEKLSLPDLTRNEAVIVSGNSKLRSTRTFKGFLANSFLPIPATLNRQLFIIGPAEGSFTFIYDYEHFIPAASVTVVGIENAENFRHVRKQTHLFQNILPLFVSRYPQSRDLVKWLGMIPNNYLHFGDLDFSGINIYLREFKKQLDEKALFFIPPGIEELLQKFGNKSLYNRQLEYAPLEAGLPDELQQLLKLFHKHKKVLEQEVFIS